MLSFVRVAFVCSAVLANVAGSTHEAWLSNGHQPSRTGPRAVFRLPSSQVRVFRRVSN